VKSNSGAVFSDDRLYRYSLWRVWEADSDLRMIAFIGLNPSTADETVDDPTVRRCINFAKRWGFGGMYMLNLFGYRATDPKDMKRQHDPVGPGNSAALIQVTGAVPETVACWGSHGSYRERSSKVLDMLPTKFVYHLGVTKGGEPKHPLYLRSDTVRMRLGGDCVNC